MSTHTPAYPSAGPSAHHTHHRPLGPLPRILVIATIIVNIPINIWATASSPPAIAYSGWPWPTIIGALLGLVLAWVAKPDEENRMRCVGIWITVVGSVVGAVGGWMIAWADGTGAASEPGYGVALMLAGNLLFLIGGIATFIIYARSWDWGD